MRLKDHDQLESAQRLREYAAQFEREPEVIEYQEPEERATIAELLNGFYRTPKKKAPDLTNRAPSTPKSLPTYRDGD